ncbi:MAG: FAD-dependent oxidoreductase [Gemmatimonadaceae bacterium]|nr:FAD-dependent oxidoreductase [Gemmatimonadaceae bacterium]MDQ3243673.1 FAD-dependent oxidoreductase [Gemmatimonadota bacterium]
MTKPVILTVDDDAAVLSAIGRDLHKQYRTDYRVMKAGSAAAGLDAATELAARNTPVALFLVDQRMPGMSGTELLREVTKLHPATRRVLLTAYADTDAAIAGINEVALDHYLMKPWDPPEERLYPVLDDLLAEWRARVRPAFEGIRVLGSQWSPQSFATKEFLSRNRVPYEWVDIDLDAPGCALAESLAGDLTRLPVVIFPDGTHLVAPSTATLASQAGMQTRANHPFYDVIVIGGGPAGLANAVYAASEGLRTILVESHAAGGQAGTSSLIENYLGFPAGVTGADLAHRATAQARRFGAELLTGQEVISLRREDPYRIVVLADGTELTAYSVVITTGMSARMLEAPGLEPLQGVGVYYGAAMSEAARCRDKDVCVVGGANSAGQGALFFSRYARRVTMLIRAADLQTTMSRYLVDRILATENIEVMYGVSVEEVHGNGSLESVIVKSADSGESRTIQSSAMFIFIGVKPHTDAFAGILERDEAGFVMTGADLPREHGRPRGWTLERNPFMFETSIPGVFAAGDVRAGANRRVAAAVGEGSAAIYSVHLYLRTV